MHEFIESNLKLFPERIEKYSPGHWRLTKDLEILGGKIFHSKIKGNPERTAFLFLLKVGEWKNPQAAKLIKTLANIGKNRISEAYEIVEKAIEAIKESNDAKAVEIIAGLHGFGKSGSSRKMVSAVLRFLAPELYGTVDYRNWAVLANQGGNYLNKKLLKPMSDTFNGAEDEPISTAQYLKYLKVIRELGRITRRTPAEVDMALFSFSDAIKPFQTRVKSWKKEAAGRMWAYVQLAPMGAAFFEKMHAAYLNGDPQVMYRLVTRAVSKKAHIGKIIEKQELVNFELIKDDLDRIKKELLGNHKP